MIRINLFRLPLYIYLSILGCSLSSCLNKEWLEIKPSKKLDVPSKLTDVIELLDNAEVMNDGVYSPRGIMSADDIVVTLSNLNRIGVVDRNTYLWKPDIYENYNPSPDHWFTMYRIVLYANLAIETLMGIKELNSQEIQVWNEALGRAYFFRGYAYYHLAQLYGDVFDEKYQIHGLGVPLRLSSDVNEISERASINETYEQIFSDLNIAAQRLSESVLLNRRPSKAAAYAMLAKTALQIQDYEKAKLYADSCLNTFNKILDYKTVNNTAYPFDWRNPEIIFFTTVNENLMIIEGYFEISPELYALYSDSDLRKTLFFKPLNGIISFKGSYNNNKINFNGITVPEILLVKAECEARLGDINNAMNSLNALLLNRYENAKIPKLPNNKDEFIEFVINERRRELVMRGTRWYDLRRLNLENKFKTEICRSVDGINFCLPANDPRYLMQIPPTVIQRSKIIQNPR